MQTEMLKVAKAKAAAIEQLDFEIDALGTAMTVPTVEVVQDALPPVVGCVLSWSAGSGLIVVG
jgi:hypothetical protein